MQKGRKERKNERRKRKKERKKGKTKIFDGMQPLIQDKADKNDNFILEPIGNEWEFKIFSQVRQEQIGSYKLILDH